MIIISQTPYRVSLGGGGSDFAEWFSQNTGATISFTIDKYNYTVLKDLPPFFDNKLRLIYSNIEEVNSLSNIRHPLIKAVLQNYNIKNGFEIICSNDLPAKSGIGSSSSFAVSLINALEYQKSFKEISKIKLAKKAAYIERIKLKELGGYQDQYAVSFGGLNFIKYTKNKIQVQNIKLNKRNLEIFEKNCLMIFTNLTRISSEVQKHKVKRLHLNKDIYKKMADNAVTIKDLLLAKKIDLSKIGNLINEGWEMKKQLSPKASNKKLDKLLDTCRKNGSLGQKIIGAGNGGFIFLLANKASQKKILKSLKPTIFFNPKISFEGSRILKF